MKPRWAPEGSNIGSTLSQQESPKAPWRPLGGPWATLRRLMLRRLHCQALRKLGSAAGPREAAMGSGRVQHRFNIVPKWVPRSSLEPPGRVLGGLENRLPKGTTSNPEGTKMASGRPPGAFGRQVCPRWPPRPLCGRLLWPSGRLLGSSWGALGDSWCALGPPGGLPEGSRGSSGRSFWKVFLESSPRSGKITRC